MVVRMEVTVMEEVEEERQETKFEAEGGKMLH
jgi:hypothetical protein